MSQYNKKQVPKQLQNEFFEVCGQRVDEYLERHTFCRFSLMNLAIQMMAHGYYHEEEKAQKQLEKPYVVFIKPTYGSEMFVPYNFGDANMKAYDENSYQRFETNDEALAFCIDNVKCLSFNEVSRAMDEAIKDGFYKRGFYKHELEKYVKQLVEKKINSL